MNKFILTMVVMLTLATSAFGQIGTYNSDLVFTPIVPCRIVDTRVAGGVITGKTSRVFQGWAATYAAQGGSATNCGLPQSTDVAALAVNLVVVGPAAEGWIAAWPSNTTMPLASNLNYKAGDVLANSAILKINQGTSEWSLHTTSTTHFVADVTGYYIKPVATALECVDTNPTTAFINLGPLNSHYYNYVVSNNCSNGYTPVSLHCIVSGAPASAAGVGLGQCVGSSPANTSSVSAYYTCCRIPGR